jgi:glycerophosphoryl diester phosphodiesterase
MRFIIFTLLIVPIALFGQSPEIFGHRGWRGAYPENSIEGFQKALELPIAGLEWDVVVNADSQLVVSHEPFFHNNICCLPDSMNNKNVKKNNIFRLSQEQIKQFPCGCKPHPSFSAQNISTMTKPLLREVISTCPLQDRTILFEIKSHPSDYHLFQPDAKSYAAIISREAAWIDSTTRIVFMSFDPNILNELNALLPKHSYLLLLYKPFMRPKKTLTKLSFQPLGFAILHHVIRKSTVKRLHALELKCLAWTVNNTNKAKRLEKWQIDGIITDYPDKISSLFSLKKP